MGGEAHFALSDTGVLAYAAGPTWGMQEQLVWVDRQGRAERISEQRDNFEQVRLSPDGRYLAFETDRLRIDVWTHDLKRGTTTRLTSEALFNTEPVWSADGQWITYKSDFGSPCLRIGRVRTPGGLHSVISQPWRAIADFNQWGPASALGEGQRRTVLSRRTQDDGRGRQNFARVLGQWPRMLFENDRMLNSYDVTADGRRFVMIDTSNNPKPTQIDVIVNWFEELKRKVPVR
jgi:dipeptidyl aminopeptidase/acylaminoacyl peptidase